MKVGILTFTNTLNFGAVLQSFALQEKVKSFGYDAEIIQYTNKFIENKEKNKSIFSPKFLLRQMVMGSALKRKEKAFRAFEKQNIVSGLKLTESNIAEVNNYYDKFITGSDQVFNAVITDTDWHFYLDFVTESKKKVSYAPSFGDVVFSEEAKKKATELLSDFNALSIREASGQKLIKEMTGKEADIVLDPTLLLSKSDWENRITFKPNLEHYILVYFPHNKKLVFDFVEKLKEKTGLPVIYLSISPRKQSGVHTIYDSSPDEFLGWIKNADYVVTGSFHGTAFSLNLEKQLFYEPLSKNGIEGRIDNLARVAGVQHRCISSANLDEVLDYSDVRNKLNNVRSKSEDWLKKALEN